MLKKAIALTLIFALLAPITIVLATENEPPYPTFEEIINNYYLQSLQTQTTEISLYSADDILESETVRALNEAGYEAYHVYRSNYYELQEQLCTDFEAMGLSPDSSYIITLGCIDCTSTSTYAFDINPDYTLPGLIGGSDKFTYTYNGVSYSMRYITVTAAENSQLGQTSTVQINSDDLPAVCDIVVSLLADSMNIGILTTIEDLVALSVPDGALTTFSNVSCTAGTNWTITYSQVYDENSSSWINCASREYVTAMYWIDYTYYDAVSNAYKKKTSPQAQKIKYSQYYNNTDTLHEKGLLAYTKYNTQYRDVFEAMEYQHNGKTVITHQRPMV